eukprot:5117139-Pleurochrysis_carterae.AAC.1
MSCSSMQAVELAELDADSSVEGDQEVRARARKLACLMRLMEFGERKRAKQSKWKKKKRCYQRKFELDHNHLPEP